MYAPPGENPGLTPGAIVNPQPSPFLAEGGGQSSPGILQLLEMLQRLQGARSGGFPGAQGENFGPTPGRHFDPNMMGLHPSPIHGMPERPTPGRQYNLTDIVRSLHGQAGIKQGETGPMQGLLRAHGLVNALQRLRLLRPAQHGVSLPPGSEASGSAGSYSHGPVY